MAILDRKEKLARMTGLAVAGLNKGKTDALTGKGYAMSTVSRSYKTMQKPFR